MRLANVSTEDLAAILNERLAALKPDERVRVLGVAREDYCAACGDAIDSICHCENDE